MRVECKRRRVENLQAGSLRKRRWGAMEEEVVVRQQGELAADAIDEAIRLVEVTRSATIDEPLFTQFSERITVIGRSIMTAGAAYPIVVTAIFTICGAIDDFVTH